MSNILEKKKAAANKKKQGKKEVDLFSDNTEKDTNDNNNTNQNDDDETDFVIDGNVVDANVNSSNKDNTNVNDQIWKEGEKVVDYTAEVKTEEAAPKKAMAWGDNIKTTAVTTAKINTENMYFPDLNDRNAEKNAPKEKKSSSLKNQGLFGDNNTGGGNWGGSGNGDRFKEQESGIRFTNSKGVNENLNKFMKKEGATYDDTLGDNVEQKADLDPTTDKAMKFSGKIKMDTGKTEADIQREKCLMEVHERAKQQDELRAQQKENRDNNTNTEDRPRFTNSKAGGFKNNGLMMNENYQNGNVENTTDEKPKFTNSNKPKKNLAPMQPELDPNVPTASKDKGVEVKVRVATWD